MTNPTRNDEPMSFINFLGRLVGVCAMLAGAVFVLVGLLSSPLNLVESFLGVMIIGIGVAFLLVRRAPI